MCTIIVMIMVGCVDVYWYYDGGGVLIDARGCVDCVSICGRYEVKNDLTTAGLNVRRLAGKLWQ